MIGLRIKTIFPTIFVGNMENIAKPNVRFAKLRKAQFGTHWDRAKMRPSCVSFVQGLMDRRFEQKCLVKQVYVPHTFA
jgi:hypothetical protein